MWCAYLFVRFELVFNFVLPNFVAAKLAVVNVSGTCERGKNELPPPLFVPAVDVDPGEPFAFFMKLLAELAGLGAEVGGEFCGDIFGLNDNALNDELTTSIGRKHCASGLNVFVTSRSADDVSSE